MNCRFLPHCYVIIISVSDNGFQTTQQQSPLLTDPFTGSSYLSSYPYPLIQRNDSRVQLISAFALPITSTRNRGFIGLSVVRTARRSTKEIHICCRYC